MVWLPTPLILSRSKHGSGLRGSALAALAGAGMRCYRLAVAGGFRIAPRRGQGTENPVAPITVLGVVLW